VIYEYAASISGKSCETYKPVRQLGGNRVAHSSLAPKASASLALLWHLLKMDRADASQILVRRFLRWIAVACIRPSPWDWR
jgi:hypothetical protein